MQQPIVIDRVQAAVAVAEPTGPVGATEVDRPPDVPAGTGVERLYVDAVAVGVGVGTSTPVGVAVGVGDCCSGVGVSVTCVAVGVAPTVRFCA